MRGARALLPVALGAALLVGGPLAAGASARAAAPRALQARTVAPALAPASPRSLPLLFGHRGAPGSLPEHTLAGYELAVQQGADVVETDLVSTRDHVLVARHDVEISRTTDVAQHPEFADRRTTRTVDGTPMTGWFV